MSGFIIRNYKYNFLDKIIMKFPFFQTGLQKLNFRMKQHSGLKVHNLERDQFKTVLESFRASRISDRLAVLDVFLSTEKHMTIAELAVITKESHPHLHDLSFLKETMEMFCQFGFAHEITFESHETRYEHLHLGAHHDHFICTRCGLIQEFSNERLEHLQLSIAKEYQFHPLQHKMEIYGLCSECMELRQSEIPLVLAANGEKVTVVEVQGGRKIQARLNDMGLSIGACIEVINNHSSGPFIVSIDNSRLAIGVNLAQKIIVSHHCKHPE